MLDARLEPRGRVFGGNASCFQSDCADRPSPRTPEDGRGAHRPRPRVLRCLVSAVG